jgi:hypothetical protein
LTNLRNNFTFVSDLVHKPSFFITYPQVGPFIRRVKKAHPAIKYKQIILHFTGTASFEAKIKVKAIPTAPLKPP